MMKDESKRVVVEEIVVTEAMESARLLMMDATEDHSDSDIVQFDVFVSHTGDDIETGFVSSLQEHLAVAGLRSLKNDIGSDTWERRKHTIKRASIVLVVLSEVFVWFEWFLRELHEILENPEIRVVPIFHDVTPSEVAFPESGILKDGFEMLIHTHDTVQIEQWRADLKHLSRLRGWEYSSTPNRLDDAELILIVQKVFELVNDVTRRRFTERIFGVKEVADNIIETLDDNSILMLGLSGVGGIGKSTLARELYNQLGKRFAASCYIGDVKDKVFQYGVENVQNYILEDLCRGKSKMITDKSKGKVILEERLCKKQILLVLDDVCNSRDLNYTVSRTMLTAGSMCIVTSRNKRVFEELSSFEFKHEVYVHDVQPLNHKVSKQLFTFHAFGGDCRVKPGFERLVADISNACGGNPLKLKVSGAFLNGENNNSLWEILLQSLKTGKLMKTPAALFDFVGMSHDAGPSQDQDPATPKATPLGVEERGVGVKQVIEQATPLDVEERGVGVKQVIEQVIQVLLYIIAFPTGLISRFFSASEGETPEFYLRLSTECLGKAQAMTSPRFKSISLKFNHEQCEFLVDQLKLAVDSADSYLKHFSASLIGSSSEGCIAKSLETFKLLTAAAKQVENFVQGSCKLDQGSLVATILPNVAGNMSSILQDIDFCCTVFLGIEQEANKSMIQRLIEDTSKIEENATLHTTQVLADKKTLLKSLTALSSNLDDEGCKLATFVSKRLESPIGGGDARIFEVAYRSLKQNSEKIGHGFRKAVWHGVPVFMKTFDGTNHDTFKEEVAILARLSHPNVLSLLCSSRNDQQSAIVTELMDEDLNSLIQRRVELRRQRRKNRHCHGATLDAHPYDEAEPRTPPFDDLESVHLILQIAKGMRYLHENGIVHRDLKSMNILVRCVKASGVEVGYALKVGDFGLSKIKGSSSAYSNETPNVGTVRWMAPEVIKLAGKANKAKYDPRKVDCYSFAMICYEIMSGYLPFIGRERSDFRRTILRGDRPSLPEQCPMKLRELVEKCWSMEASSRPTFDFICGELKPLLRSLATEERKDKYPEPATISENTRVVSRT